jgi:flagella basal body P-ring formation protein FlgA
MGQQLTSDWKSGAALTEEQIKPATQIRKGDPVALEVINGGARLRVQAKAEGSAALGSPVVLKIDGSAQRIVAKVTGPQMTQLRLER